VELSEYNGWENKFTWLMHLHLSNEQTLMQEITALVASVSSNRAAGRVLETWVKTTLFHWLSVHPERDTCFDMNMRLLAWDVTGTALAYTDWDVLVALLVGQAKKSNNLFTMALYHFILSDEQLLAFIQEMVQAFPRQYECADTMKEWFREEVDTLFQWRENFPQQTGMLALVNELLLQTYQVIVWQHVARAFRPGY
jgi:hypothetical protein